VLRRCERDKRWDRLKGGGWNFLPISTAMVDFVHIRTDSQIYIYESTQPATEYTPPSAHHRTPPHTAKKHAKFRHKEEADGQHQTGSSCTWPVKFGVWVPEPTRCNYRLKERRETVQFWTQMARCKEALTLLKSQSELQEGRPKPSTQHPHTIHKIIHKTIHTTIHATIHTASTQHPHSIHTPDHVGDGAERFVFHVGYFVV
jgi:hypothetical protein